ncbi:hypothetical protein ACJ41O_001778 [Fusarium nematophilum]
MSSSASASASAPHLPDLVQDTKLDTSFEGHFTVHHYDDSDGEQDARPERRSEYWKRSGLLGCGGCGAVYLETLEKPVGCRGKPSCQMRAVKYVSPKSRASYPPELETIAKFSQRRYSKYFVKMLGWYHQGENLCIAMEYFPLGDLQQYLKENGPMTDPDAQTVTSQILMGLNLMHLEKFAHRDIKPSNVLIKGHPPNAWWVKISDFGFSKRLSASMEELSGTVGTLGYIAPELLDAPKEGYLVRHQAADMWALGVTVSVMLTKASPFGSTAALFRYMATPDAFPRKHKEDLSTLADLFIRSVMKPRPEERLSPSKALCHEWFGNNRISKSLRNPTSTISAAVVDEEASAAFTSLSSSLSDSNTEPSAASTSFGSSHAESSSSTIKNQTPAPDKPWGATATSRPRTMVRDAKPPSGRSREKSAEPWRSPGANTRMRASSTGPGDLKAARKTTQLAAKGLATSRWARPERTPSRPRSTPAQPQEPTPSPPMYSSLAYPIAFIGKAPGKYNVANGIAQHRGHCDEDMDIGNLEPTTQVLVLSTSYSGRLMQAAEYMAPQAEKILPVHHHPVVRCIPQVYIDGRDMSEDWKLKLLFNLYGLMTIGSSAVFVETLEKAKKVERALVANGLKTAILDRDEKRHDTLKRFLDGRANCLISTIPIHGFQFPSLSMIVNYDIPMNGSSEENAHLYLRRVGALRSLNRWYRLCVNFVHDQQSFDAMADIANYFDITIPRLRHEDMGEAAEQVEALVKRPRTDYQVVESSSASEG